MSFEDQFLNFCLSCDGTLADDNEHGPYCSQACRLVDLEKGSAPHLWSLPISPIYAQPRSSFSSSSSLPRSFPSMSPGFHLPPAVDFKSYRRDSASSDQRPDSAPSRPFSMSSSAALMSPTATSSSNTTTDTISKEAKEELRRYEGLFDQSRRRDARTSWS